MRRLATALTLLIVIAVALVPAALAEPAKNVKPKKTYEGVTTQGAICGINSDEACEIALSTSKSGRKQDVAIDFSAPCDSGRTLRSTVAVESLPIPRSGRYKYRFALSVSLTGAAPGNASGEMLLDGEFKKGRTVGFSKRTELAIDFDDGTSTDCSAPRFGFNAKP